MEDLTGYEYIYVRNRFLLIYSFGNGFKCEESLSVMHIGSKERDGDKSFCCRPPLFND